ncbi:MAG TPA: glycosyltransferase family 9 protein [Acidimicrobiales bacterium]
MSHSGAAARRGDAEPTGPAGPRPPGGPHLGAVTTGRPLPGLEDIDPVERVAVLRALPGVGDMVCAVPALRTLRQRFPGARITLVGLASSRWLLDAYPRYVDELLPIDGVPVLCPPPPDVDGVLGALAEARRRRFDLAVQLHGDGSLSNQLATLLGARTTLVHHPRGRPAPQGTVAVPYPDRGHEVARLLELVDRLGLVGDARLEPPEAAARAPGTALVRATIRVPPAGYAVVHPGASHPTRRWPVAGFAEVARWLLDHDMAVVATGTDGERDVVGELCRRAPGVTDLCGRTGVNELAGVLTPARLVVSNDTGVAHLAAAVGAPSVVTFLGDDVGRWAPLDSVRHRVVPLAHRPEHSPPAAGPTGAVPTPSGPCPGLLDSEVPAVLDAVAAQLALFPADRA